MSYMIMHICIYICIIIIYWCYINDLGINSKHIVKLAMSHLNNYSNKNSSYF